MAKCSSSCKRKFGFVATVATSTLARKRPHFAPFVRTQEPTLNFARKTTRIFP